MSGTRIKREEIEGQYSSYRSGFFRKVVTDENFLEAAAAGDCQVVEQYARQNNGRFNFAYNCKAMDVWDFRKQTALMLAAKNGHLKVVQCLLNYEIDADARDARGQTALYMAVSKGHTEIVRAILQAAPMTAFTATEMNDTPINAACVDGKTEIARALLEAGAFPSGYKTLLEMAKENNKEIYYLLRLHKERVNICAKLEKRGYELNGERVRRIHTMSDEEIAKFLALLPVHGLNQPQLMQIPIPAQECQVKLK